MPHAMPPTNNATAIQARASLLRSRVHAFCQDLLASTPPIQILDQHFTRSPAIIQHGPEWAFRFLPFIGHNFLGRRTASTSPTPATTCDDYFRLLFQSLIFRQDETTYPPSAEFFVETAGHDGNGAVIVVGVAEFESVLTRKFWSEAYVYKCSGFDGRGRFKIWEIWSDVLDAWDAVSDGGCGYRDALKLPSCCNSASQASLAIAACWFDKLSTLRV